MFAGAKTLFVTGERGDESPNRARYAEFERHRADRRDGVEGGISSRKGGNSRKMGGITLKLGPTVYVFTVNSYLTVAS
jgi:3'-phosphoadenosine 5'-phosphosulfate sulfotransferase (PAPS reductase)/FAD synthetase